MAKLKMCFFILIIVVLYSCLPDNIPTLQTTQINLTPTSSKTRIPYPSVTNDNHEVQIEQTSSMSSL